jgi:hypothetical protein
LRGECEKKALVYDGNVRKEFYTLYVEGKGGREECEGGLSFRNGAHLSNGLEDVSA